MTMKIPDRTMNDWPFVQRAIYQFVKWLVPQFCRKFFQFEVNGIEHANKFPEGTPVIFCGNHRSHLDAFLIGSAIVNPYGKRTRLGFMGAGKVMQRNPFYRMLRFLGAYPVFPENPEPALHYSCKLLKEKTAIFIAPQGKRIQSHPYHDYFNLIHEGKTGIGRLILKMNGKIPVVPAYIHGSAEALSQGSVIPKFGSFISVSFSKPLFWHKYTRKRGWKETDSDFYTTAREIVDKIMHTIRDQLIIQEKHYFDLLKIKFGTTIDNIIIPPEKEAKFNKILSKLVKV
ncbi:MAG: lysophospholipid acyltransferase family protein, partial [Candidatus Hodarchaeota archaeon]